MHLTTMNNSPITTKQNIVTSDISNTDFYLTVESNFQVKSQSDLTKIVDQHEARITRRIPSPPIDSMSLKSQGDLPLLPLPLSTEARSRTIQSFTNYDYSISSGATSEYQPKSRAGSLKDSMELKQDMDRSLQLSDLLLSTNTAPISFQRSPTIQAQYQSCCDSLYLSSNPSPDHSHCIASPSQFTDEKIESLINQYALLDLSLSKTVHETWCQSKRRSRRKFESSKSKPGIKSDKFENGRGQMEANTRRAIDKMENPPITQKLMNGKENGIARTVDRIKLAEKAKLRIPTFVSTPSTAFETVNGSSQSNPTSAHQQRSVDPHYTIKINTALTKWRREKRLARDLLKAKIESQEAAAQKIEEEKRKRGEEAYSSWKEKYMERKKNGERWDSYVWWDIYGEQDQRDDQNSKNSDLGCKETETQPSTRKDSLRSSIQLKRDINPSPSSLASPSISTTRISYSPPSLFEEYNKYKAHPQYIKRYPLLVANAGKEMGLDKEFTKKRKNDEKWDRLMKGQKSLGRVKRPSGKAFLKTI